jgi:hypothetical protein
MVYGFRYGLGVKCIRSRVLDLDKGIGMEFSLKRFRV